jgi:hypothetical protein
MIEDHWARRRHSIFAVIEVFRPPDQSLAGTGHLRMQAAWTLASAGQDDRLLRTYMSASPGQATSQNDCRRQALANVTETWRSSCTSTPGADLGDLSRRCLVRASAVSPASSWSTVVKRAYVSLPARAAAIFPAYEARYGF